MWKVAEHIRSKQDLHHFSTHIWTTYLQVVCNGDKYFGLQKTPPKFYYCKARYNIFHNTLIDIISCIIITIIQILYCFFIHYIY